MKLSDLDYDLPRELIAAYPPEDRASARLLCVDRSTGKTAHRIFRDIADSLKAGDVLVLNNTRVIPARLFAQKETGGKVELLLLEERKENVWKTLIRPGGRVREGARLSLGQNGTSLEAEVLSSPLKDSGERLVRFMGPAVKEVLQKIGHIPLPPYIDRPDSEIDRELYQTVFAEKDGAVASPTAGLHFNEALLQTLREKGVEIVFITLHVGYGTFQPIGVDDLSQHKMHEEAYEISGEAAGMINAALSEGRRIIACGTTSVRTLEAAATAEGRVSAGNGKTNLFIYPPYSFKIVSGMITNFHLPKTSLLCLVAAFLGGEMPQLFSLYKEAIAERYRFFSYGDAMFIL